MIVAGIRVGVRFGDDGRPLFAIAGIERPGDLEHERLVDLAAKRAFEAAQFAAGKTQRKRASATAADESGKKRATASAEHWANDWFAKAHAAHPGHGKARLAQFARHLAATDKDKEKRIEDAAKRDEINEQRARQFLARLRRQHP